MNWMPSGLGAEPKKLAVLGGLLVTIVGVYFYNQEPEVTVATAPRATQPAPIIPAPSVSRPASRPQQKAKGRANEDFHPTLKLPEDFDLSQVDPTLRTDLLAKVRGVGEVGGSRSLFEFYVPPPPPPPPVKDINPIDFGKAPRAQETKPAPPADPGPPKPPPPPPIPLKYYGYEGQPKGGKLKAFFIDGEETFRKGPGEMIRNRYRIVRIGPTSAEVEDTVAKNTQTLRIVEQCEGNCK